jgi:hypothetical protein
MLKEPSRDRLASGAVVMRADRKRYASRGWPPLSEQPPSHGVYARCQRIAYRDATIISPPTRNNSRRSPLRSSPRRPKNAPVSVPPRLSSSATSTRSNASATSPPIGNTPSASTRQPDRAPRQPSPPSKARTDPVRAFSRTQSSNRIRNLLHICTNGARTRHEIEFSQTCVGDDVVVETAGRGRGLLLGSGRLGSGRVLHRRG